MKYKLKKGDKVQMIAGSDRVKKTKSGDKTTKTNQGKVMQVFLESGKVVVEGLNLKTKHLRPKRQCEKGQKIEFPSAVDISNVMLICPKCNQPARVGYKFLDSKEKGHKKIRQCRKCKEAIDG